MFTATIQKGRVLRIHTPDYNMSEPSANYRPSRSREPGTLDWSTPGAQRGLPCHSRGRGRRRRVGGTGSRHLMGTVGSSTKYTHEKTPRLHVLVLGHVLRQKSALAAGQTRHPSQENEVCSQTCILADFVPKSH